MHMSDALISPAVGGTMWAVSAGTIAYAAHKVKHNMDDFRVPLMGVMGAFIFAAQMINFTIPGTGSSGHICGTLLLSIILGPYAAVLVITSVLVIQALIFADGGLLALGCNIFNMGIIPALIAYPLLYRPIVKKELTGTRLWTACIISSIIALQLGAGSVVIETKLSGISQLPLTSFLMLMLPIHFAIGLIEGIITASVLVIIRQARPEIMSDFNVVSAKRRLKPVIIALFIGALLTAGLLSWFASQHPDGLEWSVAKTTNGQELNGNKEALHSAAARLQQHTAVMADYQVSLPGHSNSSAEHWGQPNASTSLAGMSGALLTLIIAAAIGFILKQRFKSTAADGS